MYEREYEKLIEFVVQEFPDEIGKGNRKCGESAAEVAIRLLKEYKPLAVFAPVHKHIIDLDKKKAQLIERIDQLSEDISSIDYQLSCAIQKKLETGQYADIKWFTAAKNAKKAKRAEIAKIQRELHRINSEIKANRAKTYERLFVEAAKDSLNDEQYSTISRIAFDRMGKMERIEVE
ncbi:MAG: hypothetical protein GX457_18060 [Thermotogaceae bacterium]|nr:hypothetical protein [Thermotogaceae bacterium]